MRNEGYRNDNVARWLGVRPVTVQSIYSRYRSTGAVEYRRRTGPKLKITPRVQAWIRQQLLDSPHTTLPELRRCLKEKFDVDVAIVTVRLAVKRLEFPVRLLPPVWHDPGAGDPDLKRGGASVGAATGASTLTTAADDVASVASTTSSVDSTAWDLGDSRELSMSSDLSVGDDTPGVFARPPLESHVHLPVATGALPVLSVDSAAGPAVGSGLRVDGVGDVTPSLVARPLLESHDHLLVATGALPVLSVASAAGPAAAAPGSVGVTGLARNMAAGPGALEPTQLTLGASTTPITFDHRAVVAQPTTAPPVDTGAVTGMLAPPVLDAVPLRAMSTAVAPGIAPSVAPVVGHQQVKRYAWPLRLEAAQAEFRLAYVDMQDFNVMPRRTGGKSYWSPDDSHVGRRVTLMVAVVPGEGVVAHAITEEDGTDSAELAEAADGGGLAGFLCLVRAALERINHGAMGPGTCPGPYRGWKAGRGAVSRAGSGSGGGAGADSCTAHAATGDGASPGAAGAPPTGVCSVGEPMPAFTRPWLLVYDSRRLPGVAKWCGDAGVGCMALPPGRGRRRLMPVDAAYEAIAGAILTDWRGVPKKLFGEEVQAEWGDGKLGMSKALGFAMGEAAKRLATGPKVSCWEREGNVAFIP